MSMYIKRAADKRRVRAMVANLADIPNGVTLCSSELIAGTVVPEGSLVAIGNDGLAHLVKTAKVYETADSSATAYKVCKGHQFKVGDILTTAAGSAGKAISAIDTTSSDAYDTITVSATIGAATAGAVLKQANAAGSSSVLKYSPSAILGDGYDVDGSNQFVVAVTIGQFKAALVAPIDAALKTALQGNGAYINFV